ncbi:MAG: glycosyltransferase [Planctomycetes bacterium]|nr:glycosyltransferase [Planctomycetota bacterium]
MASFSEIHESNALSMNTQSGSHPWLEAAMSLWSGRSILVLGLNRPEVAIELARRGASVIAVDPDPTRVQRARELESRCGARVAIYQSSLERADEWMRGRADVAIAADLPAGLACTLILETAFRGCSHVLVATAELSRIPDRFAAMAQCERAQGVTLLANADTQPTLEFTPRMLTTRSAPSLGEEASERAMAAALAAATELPQARIGRGGLVAIVREREFTQTGPDAAAISLREPDRMGAVAVTSTRTDRFSAEHVAVLERFEEVWVPSASHRAFAIASGVVPERVRVVPDAVDTLQFRPRLKAVGNFRTLAILSSARRMREAQLSVRAFLEELGSEPTASLDILVGRGVEIPAVEGSLDAALGAGWRTSCVRLITSVPYAQMPALYAQYDLLLRPTSGERRAMAMLEAMACGIPVAATRFGIVAEIVNCDTGYPIEPKGLELCDPVEEDVPLNEAGHRRPLPSLESIRAALRAAFSDPGRRIELGSSARRFIASTRSIEAVAGSLLYQSAPEIRELDEEPAAEEEEVDLSALARELAPDVLLDLGRRFALRTSDLENAAHAREIWCTSPLSEQAWIGLGIERPRLRLVPPSVDVRTFHPRVRPSVLGTRTKTRVLIDASRGLASGSDLAVRALSACGVKQVALVVHAADATTRASLETLAGSLESSLELIFVPEAIHAPARASLIATCDLLLDLTRGSNDGRWVLEAAACGKPSVASMENLPAGTLYPSSGYPIASTLRAMTLGEEAGLPAIACEAEIEETALVLRRALEDTVGRKRRGVIARNVSMAFAPSKRRRWIEQRRRELSLPRSTEPTITVVGPAGIELPTFSEPVTFLGLSGRDARGGLALEATRAIESCATDLALFVTGGFQAHGAWLRALSQQFISDPELAVSIARDEHGAMLMLRPNVMARLAFSAGFITPAFAVDFVRSAVRAGLRVAAAPVIDACFVPSSPEYATEVLAVESLAHAEEALERKDLETALDEVQVALASQPRYAAGYELATRIFVEAGMLGDAAVALATLTKIEPRDVVPHALLARVERARGNMGIAARRMAIAYGLAPNDTRIAREYGEVLLACGHDAQAAEIFLSALQMEPADGELALGAAEALERLGRAKEALELLQAMAPEEAGEALATLAP